MTKVETAVPTANEANVEVIDPRSTQIAANLAEIVPAESKNRSKFLDFCPWTPFFLVRQYDRKQNEKGEYNNTFGVVGFPEPVKAKVNKTPFFAKVGMVDLSELLKIAQEKGLELFMEDGTVNPAIELMFAEGIPDLR